MESLPIADKENEYIEHMRLYELFLTRPLNETNMMKNTSSISTPPTLPILSTPKSEKTVSQLSMLSPNAKKIYETAHVEDKEHVLHDLIKDSELVEQLEMSEYMNDLEYTEKMANNMLGFYIESFIAYNGMCPLCSKKTLRKYNMSNMPVIDLICINPFHIDNNECFLYQVKTSVGKNSYFGETFATIGSKKFGYNSHMVRGTDTDEKKKLVIGYICINLKEDTVDNNKFTIVPNMKKSFIVIPKIQSKLNEYFYTYDIQRYPFNKNIIKWNGKMATIMDISKCIVNYNVNTNIVFNDTIIENPYINFPKSKMPNEWAEYQNSKNKKRKGYTLYHNRRQPAKRYKLVKDPTL